MLAIEILIYFSSFVQYILHSSTYSFRPQDFFASRISRITRISCQQRPLAVRMVPLSRISRVLEASGTPSEVILFATIVFQAHLSIA
jgi:hypothetical protein